MARQEARRRRLRVHAPRWGLFGLLAGTAAGAGVAAGLPDITPEARMAFLLATVALTWTLAVLDRRMDLRGVQAARAAPATPPAAVAGVAPRILQLSPDIADFTNRSAELERVTAELRRASAPDVTAVPVVAVSGKGGIGKSALAVHVAHRLRPQFPDGQIHVDLRGVDARPLDPGQLLGELLVELGVEASAVPDAEGDRVRRYRNLLAERRMLVLLDNAADEAQVRPLLPGTHGCAVIVTSRRPLLGLEGAARVPLDVLEPAASLELLDRVTGPGRLDADPGAARRLAELCGGLPLAVRIAGGKLASSAVTPLAALAARLDDEHRLLSELTLGDLEVRASFLSSYRLLDATVARGFRLLALLEVPDFPVHALAALLAVSTADAERVVDALLDNQLLEVAGVTPLGHVRYRFHDLVRAFARERLHAEDDEGVRTAALRRALEAYLGWLAVADELLTPGDVHRLPAPAPAAAVLAAAPELADAIRADAVSWFAFERPSLVRLIAQADRAGLDRLVWELAERLNACAESRVQWGDWMQALEIALAASRRAGDRLQEARARFRLADALVIQERLEEAAAHLEACLPVFRELGDQRAVALAQLDLGYTRIQAGRLDEAEANLTACLAAFEREGDGQRQAEARSDLALVREAQGDLEQAQAHMDAALVVFRAAGDHHWLAFGLANLGRVQLARGDRDAALRSFAEALPLLERINDRLWSAEQLSRIGHAFADEGDQQAAERAWSTAVRIYRMYERPEADQLAALVRSGARAAR